MIKELTEQQTRLLEVYRDKWIKIGLSTEPTNKERALSNVPAYYKEGGLEAPKAVVFAESPKAAMVILSILLEDKFWAHMDKAYKLAKEDLQLVSDTVVAILTKGHVPVTELDTLILNAINKAPKKVSWNYSFAGGNLWPGWQAFYNFFDQELQIPGVEKIRPTIALSQDVGWIFPYENLCVLTEKPKEINMDAQGRLHNEHGMSIKWKDGYGLYSLHGVTVPEFLFATPKDKVDVTKVLQLPTEQRMAAMRFLGLEKFLGALNAEEIDRLGDYVLYYLTVDNIKVGPYLSMVCPSSGRRFLEGVGDEQKYENIDPTITTVTQALFERASRASKRLMTKYADKLSYHA